MSNAVCLSVSLSYLCSSLRAVCSRSPADPEPHSTPVSTRKQSRGSSCLVAFWRLTIQSRSRSRSLARSPRLPYPLNADSNRRLRPETKLSRGFRRGASGKHDQIEEGARSVSLPLVPSENRCPLSVQTLIRLNPYYFSNFVSGRALSLGIAIQRWSGAFRSNGAARVR